MPERTRNTTLLAMLAYAAIALAFQAWRLDRPVGLHENNLGQYFGPSLRAWEAFGFFEMCGMPTWLHYPRSIESAFAYPNHPPAVFWLMYVFGTSEWALRLPGLIGGWLAASMLFILLRRRTSTWLALPAGVALLLCPGISVLSIGSYEAIVVAAGLALFVAADPLGPGGWAALQRPRRLLGISAIAFVGPILDWQFAFYALALVCLNANRDLRGWFRVLWPPGIAASLSAALIVAWRSWAFEASALAAPPHGGLDALLEQTVFQRPDLGTWLHAAGHLVVQVSGWPVAIAAALGLPLLLGSRPLLWAALVVGGVSPAVAFSVHALDHAIFYTLMTPWIVTCAVMPWWFLARIGPRSRATAIAGVWALAICAGVASELYLRKHSSLYPREVAATMVERARAEPGKVVLTDYSHVFLYYVDDPRVLTMTVQAPQLVESLRSSHDAKDGVLFLWWDGDQATPLGEYLSLFESEPVEFPDYGGVDAPGGSQGPRWVRIPRR